MRGPDSGEQDADNVAVSKAGVASYSWVRGRSEGRNAVVQGTSKVSCMCN